MMAAPARASGLRIAAGLGLVATLAACTSSSPPGPSTGTGPSHRTPSSAPPSSGPSPTASNRPAGVPAAPTGLQAFPLLTGAGLATALGGPLRGIQDDGGTTTPEGFLSLADTESRLTTFEVGLQTYAKPADASAAYSQLTASGGRPLPGVGDKAMDQVATQVIVLKSSQILTVRVNTTPAGLNYIAQNDKSPASLMTVLDKPARAAARAIAPHLSGDAVTGTYLQLPAGALDPCALSIQKLARATKQDVTAVHAPSEERPAQQCDVNIGTSPYLVQTYTSTQAAAAVPATTLAAVYAADAKVHTPGQRVQTASAHLRAFMDVDTDFTLELLITGAPAHGLLATPETAHQALLRIRNAHTAPMSREHCYALGEEAGLQLVVGMPMTEANQFFDELNDWCRKFPSGH